MKDSVLTTIRGHRLLSPGDRVIMGVSGGADSMVLMDILASLSTDLSLTLGVAHLNHNTRGDASRSDADFVAREAAKRGLPFFTETVDVPTLARSRRQGLEEAGRDARYLFFRRAADHFRASRVALAHTADDQAETFVMRMGRGAGLRGLSGIPIQRKLSGESEVTIIRPLLHESRARVLDYARDYQVPFIIDESNADPSFLRNRVRREIVTRLKDIFPPLVESVSEAQEGLRSDFEFINAETAKILPDIVIEASQSVIVFDGDRYKSLHRSLQYYALLWAVDWVATSRAMVSRDHFKRFLAHLDDKEPWIIEFPGGIKAAYRSGRIEIRPVN